MSLLVEVKSNILIYFGYTSKSKTGNSHSDSETQSKFFSHEQILFVAWCYWVSCCLLGLSQFPFLTLSVPIIDL